MPLNFLLSSIMISIHSVIHGLFALLSLLGITFSFPTLKASCNSSHCFSAVFSPISSFIASYLFFTTTLYLVFMSSSFLSVISCLFGIMFLLTIFFSLSLIVAITGTWSLEQSAPGYVLTWVKAFLNLLLIMM